VRDAELPESREGDLAATLEGVLDGVEHRVDRVTRVFLTQPGAICDLVDELRPDATLGSRRKLIKFVADRPGHDRRYAIDARKIARELGWEPSVDFEHGLRNTVEWYLNHASWIENVRSGAYLTWIKQNYEERIAQ